MSICHHHPFPLTPPLLPHHLHLPTPTRCNLSLTSTQIPEPQPIYTSVTSFAPATVANLGPGFDFLGCAVDGIGDHVTLSLDPLTPPGHLSISHITGSGLESEAKVSGYHADNIAPAIMGGFVLIRSYDPLELVSLKFPNDKDLCFVLVNPEFEAPTKKMRAALPPEISMKQHVWNSSQAGALVAAVLQGDVVGLGKALSSDKVVEPRRAPLIPGMEGVKRAALEAGAFGCTISGAGPTAVAVVDDEEKGRVIGEKMVEAFMVNGNLKAVAMVKKLDRVGARLVSSVSR